MNHLLTHISVDSDTCKSYRRKLYSSCLLFNQDCHIFNQTYIRLWKSSKKFTNHIDYWVSIAQHCIITLVDNLTGLENVGACVSVAVSHNIYGVHINVLLNYSYSLVVLLLDYIFCILKTCVFLK